MAGGYIHRVCRLVRKFNLGTGYCRGVLGLFIVLLIAAAYAEENWPQFRGPHQTGVANAAELPETWSETENIVWRSSLPSWSGGSPVIRGDRIFVTSPSKPEANPGDSSPQRAGGPNLLLLCISKRDGSVLWERELDTGNKLISKQNASSPSPVTDGEHVWAVTGTGTVAALTMDGEILWKRNLQTDYGPFGLQFGYASSPLLCDGKLVLQVLHGFKTDAPSYLVAFDALSGKDRWRIERSTDALRESRDSYNTPTLLRYEGKTQIIVSGGDCVTGHDPQTGKEVWRSGGLNPRNSDKNRMIVSPVAVDGMIYAGSSRKPLLTLRAGGEGDVTTTHLVWKYDGNNGPDVPTPACDGAYFYLVDDRGVITALNAKTGEVIWGPQRTANGVVSASPLVADGKIYITTEEGVTTVLADGPQYRLLATNTLRSEGRTLSSLGVSGNQLFLRTPTHLYCIAKKEQ